MVKMDILIFRRSPWMRCRILGIAILHMIAAGRLAAKMK